MIHWAIKACKESIHKIDVWVTTDSEEIASIAKERKVNVVFRDVSTANDSAYKQAAIREAAKKIDVVKGPSDVYISLQPNSPEIKSIDIDKAIDCLLKNNKNEIISADSNHMQNGAFRIFKGDYVYQQDLSTNCGFIICDLFDVHTKEDVELLESRKIMI